MPAISLVSLITTKHIDSNLQNTNFQKKVGEPIPGENGSRVGIADWERQTKNRSSPLNSEITPISKRALK